MEGFDCNGGLHEQEASTLLLTGLAIRENKIGEWECIFRLGGQKLMNLLRRWHCQRRRL